MLYSIFILFCCPFLGSALETQRDQKSFSLFSVLKWQNSACQAVSDDALQGVCYTKQECDDLGGTEDGNCAAGFGTCCVISLSGTANSPGGTVTQNCTFIQNVDYPSAETNTRNYEYMITKCSSEICQVRLDFLVANFAQPNQADGDCTMGDRDIVTLDAGGDDPNRVLLESLQDNTHIWMFLQPTQMLQQSLLPLTQMPLLEEPKTGGSKYHKLNATVNTEPPKDACNISLKM